MRGAQLFEHNCAACRRTPGKSYDGAFPALALNSTVNAHGPSSVIHIIIKGAEMPSTAAAPVRSH